MFKILKADKDAYITDRVINDVRQTSSNTGHAGTCDLFKLYGLTSSGSNPNIELSRALIHFDLAPLRALVTSGKVDTTNPSFACTLKMRDVYGGQPTPSNFTLVAYPLSRSFDEGIGRDVVMYSDYDVCNFLTGSRSQGTWVLSGCNQGGGPTDTVDFITASDGASFASSQLFVDGTEDLSLDVTAVVSATLAGVIPDQGFRVSFDASLENDQHTYFVKRFASHTAYSEDKHPTLTVTFDDSIQDDSQNLALGQAGTLFMYSYVQNRLSNIISGSSFTPITGSNSLLLNLVTEISGGSYVLTFSGSQHTVGMNPATGIYSASVVFDQNDAVLTAKILASGSAKVIPVWGSLDGTVGYLTGTALHVRAPDRSMSAVDPRKYVVSTIGLEDTYFSDEEAVVRTNIFDYTSPVVKATRVAVELPGIVVRDVHYQIRDDATGEAVVPFDTTHNSTRLSSDASGMYFRLDASNLIKNRSYVIDILIVSGDNRQIYRNTSPVFKVSNAR